MAVMAAGGACFVKRALGVMVLLAILLVAGWTASGPTYAAPDLSQFTEDLTARPAEPEANPRADARPAAPPYAIARKPGGSARSEQKRLQPSDNESPNGIAAAVADIATLQSSTRDAQRPPSPDHWAKPFRGFRFLSRAPPGSSTC
jgi:hypothetical protein